MNAVINKYLQIYTCFFSIREVTLYTCMREVSGSNIGRDTACPEWGSPYSFYSPRKMTFRCHLQVNTPCSLWKVMYQCRLQVNTPYSPRNVIHRCHLFTQEGDAPIPPPGECPVFTQKGDVPMPTPGECSLFTQECYTPMPSIHPGRWCTDAAL